MSPRQDAPASASSAGTTPGSTRGPVRGALDPAGSSRRERTWLLLILAAFASLAAAHAWRVPMFEGPDEDSNLELVRFIDLEGRLPTPSATPTPELEVLERGIVPPLWFVAQLPLLRALGLSGVAPTPITNELFLRDQGFLDLVAAEGLTLDEALARPGSRNRYLHGPDEAGAGGEGADAVAALRWLRASAIPWGMLALLAAHGALRRALGSGRHALWFTAGLAMTPQLQFLSGNLNMDAMLAAFGCVALWALVEWVAGDERRTLAWAALAGTAAGLACLTKLNGLVLAPMLPVAAWLARHRGRHPLGSLLLAGLTLVLVAGPYLLWGWLESGHPLWMWAYQDASPLHNRAGQEPAVWNLEGLWNYHLVLFLTWFGDIGWTSVWFEPTISYPILALFVAGAVLGLTRLWGERQEVGRGEPDAAARWLLGCGAVLMLTAELWFNLRFSQPQGRHLYPFLVAVVFPVLYGLERLYLLKPFVLGSALLSLLALPLLVERLRPEGFTDQPWVAATDAGRAAAPDLAEADATVAWRQVTAPAPDGDVGPLLSWETRPDHTYELLLSVGAADFVDAPWRPTGGLLRSARVFRRPLGGEAMLPGDFWAELPPGTPLAFQVLELDPAGATSGRSVVRTLVR